MWGVGEVQVGLEGMEGFATGFAARRATRPGHTAAREGWRVEFQGVMCNEVRRK